MLQTAKVGKGHVSHPDRMWRIFGVSHFHIHRGMTTERDIIIQRNAQTMMSSLKNAKKRKLCLDYTLMAKKKTGPTMAIKL